MSSHSWNILNIDPLMLKEYGRRGDRKNLKARGEGRILRKDVLCI